MASELNTIRVMLVDDSAVVRGLVQRALKKEPSIVIAATAVDGQMAVDTLKRHTVDVIVLDIEMPGMDGIKALPELLKVAPGVKIIMASTLTQQNAEISVRALELGATDYIAKPSNLADSGAEDFFHQLITKIKQICHSSGDTSAQKTPKPVSKPTLPSIAKAEALAIASSTGGPQALLRVFTALKGKAQHVPIFITQHMPPSFTAILADHIGKVLGSDCHEAKDGEEVKSGVVYLAPGDFHMTVERRGTSVVLQLNQDPPENFCRPAADPMLRSLAAVYRNRLLVAVLTGMGSDGVKGAADVVKAGGVVIAQDQASCVVYGMPKAVVDAHLASAVLPIDQVAPYLIKAVGQV